MSYLDANRTPERIKSAIGVALILAVGSYAALTMRGSEVLSAAQESLSTFDVRSPPPPPPTPEPEPQPSKAKEGKAAPENVRSKPTQVVARKPFTPPIPLPVKAAEVAGEGNASAAGAGDRPGPGTGAGGVGNGLGSGGAGDGTGSGGIATKPRRIRGDISDRDFRKLPESIKVDGTVTALVTVGTDGRAKACTIERSSGSPQLDARTCELIKQRFVYEPARDAAGRPVESKIYRTQRYCLVARVCTI